MNYFLKQIVVIRIYINILKMHFSCYKDNKKGFCTSFVYSVFFDEMGSSINFAYYCLTISKEYSLFGNKMIAYGKYYF